MERKLNVAAVPMNIIRGDRDKNLSTASRLIRSLSRDTDVAVLPELFSTGFLGDGSRMAEMCDSDDNQPNLMTLKKLAAECNTAICGSYIHRDGQRGFVNRCVFVEPNGEVTKYDKRHLFCMGREQRLYVPGREERPVVRFRGWDITMSVCYDVRFPVWMRATERKPYDIMLVPANWPTARGYAWEHLLIARAIENQAYIVGANRSGEDDFGSYDGNSFIFDFNGMPVAKADAENAEAPISASLSREELFDARKAFPVGNDADSFSIKG